MWFRLPNYTELDEVQRNILNLPTNKSFVIKGDPGTGKTVMAFHRALQMRNKKVLMLVYNRPLMCYFEPIVKDMEYCEIKTYHQWFYEFYRKVLKKEAPTISKHQFDWKQVLKDIDNTNINQIYDHVIIDEAQDFPKVLVCLLKMLSKNATYFIDPNQKIENGSTPESLLDIIGEECPYELNVNYRNSLKILNLAKLFKDNNISKTIDNVNDSIVMLTQTEDYDDQNSYFQNIIHKSKEEQILIFSNYGKGGNQLWALYYGLKDLLDDDIDIQVYDPNSYNRHLDFTKDSGVVILTYGTLKGLESDIVLMPRIEYIQSVGDVDLDDNRMYVAITRARKELYMTHINDTTCFNCVPLIDKIKNNKDIKKITH